MMVFNELDHYTGQNIKVQDMTSPYLPIFKSSGEKANPIASKHEFQELPI